MWRAFSQLWFLALVTFVVTVGCKSDQPADAPYTAGEGAVGFDVSLENGPATMEGSTGWLATYKAGGRTAHFRIELNAPDKTSNGELKVSFGKGRFVAQPGSDATVLIADLKKALEAKNSPGKIVRVANIPFEYAIIGDRLYRQNDGGLSGDRRGNWMAIKLFLGGDQGEVYLNLNPVAHKGEFSIKDPDYGDFVVGELAKVL